MAAGLEARNYVDYATLTVSSTAVGLASASPVPTTKVKRAIITVETDQVRWRADGDAPTATEGHLMDVGDVLQMMDANYESLLSAIKFIRVSSTDAKLKISYFD